MALTLKPYQKQGVLLIDKFKNPLLADEMGLGKTVQVIGWLNKHWPESKPKVLIICPAFLLENWVRELKSKRKYKLDVVHIIETKKATIPTSANIFLCSYNIASAQYKELQKMKFDVMVIDECHYLNNPEAIRTKRIYGISNKSPGLWLTAKKKIVMSGTPASSGAHELHNMLLRLNPEAINNMKRKEFTALFSHEKNFSIVSPRTGRRKFITKPYGVKNADKLKTLLRKHYMIRRLKKDVLPELPEKTHSILWIAPDENIKVLQKEETREKFIQCASAEFDSIEHLSRYAFSEKMATVRRLIGEQKVNLAIDSIKYLQSQAGKIVIFAQHHSVIDALCLKIGTNHIKKITGRVPKKQRYKILDDFQNDYFPFLALQTDAAGVGLNITSASVCVFLEPVWSPEKLDQAVDRLHRIGQKNPVFAYHCIVPDTFDEYIFQKQHSKRLEMEELFK